jgi:hypothetical protein
MVIKIDLGIDAMFQKQIMCQLYNHLRWQAKQLIFRAIHYDSNSSNTKIQVSVPNPDLRNDQKYIKNITDKLRIAVLKFQTTMEFNLKYIEMCKPE